MPNKEKLLVSVVLSTYNGEAYIDEQLTTIVNQTYRNIEIVITDDCSTDGTPAKLKKWAEADSRIKLYFNEANMGFNANFMKGCTMATGELIAIADQDDIWKEEKIEMFVQHWPKDAILMHCISHSFSGSPEHIRHQSLNMFEGSDVRELSVFNTVSGHAMLATKDFLLSIMPFKKGAIYDWYAAAKAACIYKVDYLPQALVFHRIHDNNVTVSENINYRNPKYRNNYKAIELERMKVFAEIPEMKEEYKKFYRRLITLWEQSMKKKFSWALFFFMIANHKIIFSQKAKSFFSHLKHMYYLSAGGQ